MQGRNFDYGQKKSDSKEGQMARRALLTMAKDLYNLYITLNDHDDLPEWCHYKLATSRKDLSDIADYLTSKVMKMCVDKKMSSEELRLEINNSMTGNILEEGFFDFFKSKSNKGFSSRFYKDSKVFSTEKNSTIKALMLMKNLSVIYEKYIKQYHSDFLMNLDLPDAYSGVDKDNPDFRNFYKSLASAMIGVDYNGINIFLEASRVFVEKVNDTIDNTSSARKKPQKSRSIKNLFGLRESAVKKEIVDITINAIKELQVIVLAGESEVRNALHRGIKLNDIYNSYSGYEKSDIDLEIKNIAKNIEGLFLVYDKFSKSEKISLSDPIDKESEKLLNFDRQFNIDGDKVEARPQPRSSSASRYSSARSGKNIYK